MKAKLYAAGIAALVFIVLTLRLGPVKFGLILLGLAAIVAAARFAWWAFVPSSDLPRNRVRHTRIRLYLFLHPGRGHATWWELHRQWGRRGAYKRAAQVRVVKPS